MNRLDEDTLALLAAYAEGELDGDDLVALEARIAAEPAVAAELAAMRAMSATLHDIGSSDAAAAPEDFANRVAQRIRRRSAGRFFREEASEPRSMLWVVLAVTAVIFGLLAIIHQTDTVQILTDSPLAPVIDDAPVDPTDGSATPPPTPADDGHGANPDLNEGLPERSATREGFTSGGRYANATRRENVYLIQSGLRGQELEQALVQRVGGALVVQHELGFGILAEAGDVPTLVSRLNELGPVTIENVDIPPSTQQTPTRIVVVSGP